MRRILFGLGALAVAAACTPTAPLPVKSLALADGAMTANAPAGYCIDVAASRPNDGFAVMAPCVSLGREGNLPDILGVATVQVGPATSATVIGSEDALISLLESDAGAVLLSSVGAASDITVIDTQTGENTVTVHFNDTGAPLLAGLDGEEWRAFTDIDGRLVTVAVRGLATAPFPDGTGSWQLNLIVTGLIGTNDVAVGETSDS